MPRNSYGVASPPPGTRATSGAIITTSSFNALLDDLYALHNEPKAPTTTPGTVSYFARSTAPDGWLKANGAVISRTAYGELFAAIGTTFGAGNGTTTFAIPDLRGEFARGLDDGRGVDANRALGTVQTADMASHSHSGSTSTDGNHGHSGSTSTDGSHTHDYTRAGYNGNDGGSGLTVARAAAATNQQTGAAGSHAHSLSINAAGAHSHSVTINATGGAETRPRNVALLACIKF